jgi:membrane-bound ClpP family serine protease
MRPILHYVLLQIPGIILVSALLWLAWSYEIITTEIAWAVLALWLLKDALLYPLVSPVLRRQTPATGAQALVGEKARARTDIAERGMVHVRGELWQARSRDGSRIPANTTVVVVSAQGLRLMVARQGQNIDQSQS